MNDKNNTSNTPLLNDETCYNHIRGTPPPPYVQTEYIIEKRNPNTTNAYGVILIVFAVIFIGCYIYIKR
jgi:dihydrofolate reductase